MISPPHISALAFANAPYQSLMFSLPHLNSLVLLPIISVMRMCQKPLQSLHFAPFFLLYCLCNTRICSRCTGDCACCQFTWFHRSPLAGAAPATEIFCTVICFSPLNWFCELSCNKRPVGRRHAFTSNYLNLYSHHYSMTFAFSNLSNLHCYRLVSQQIFLLQGAIQGFHVPQK